MKACSLTVLYSYYLFAAVCSGKNVEHEVMQFMFPGVFSNNLNTIHSSIHSNSPFQVNHCSTSIMGVLVVECKQNNYYISVMT